MDDNNLLQTIFISVGCSYLSDLHSGEYNHIIQNILLKIPPDDFPTEEWNDAINYICRKQETFPSASPAKDFILSWLENPQV